MEQDDKKRLLSWTTRQALVSSVRTELCTGTDRELIVSYLKVLAEYLALGLDLEDIEVLLPPPTSPNKPLEAS